MLWAQKVKEISAKSHMSKQPHNRYSTVRFMARSRDGEVWEWGKGDGNEAEHIRAGINQIL